MTLKRRTAEIADQVQQTIASNDVPEIAKRQKIVWETTPIVSTGSTLLDLAISGGRIYEGGLPCCILCEVYGPSGSGKTAILSEVGGNAEMMGGENCILDPEARMDEEYARIYGLTLSKKNYHRPETIAEIFEKVKSWQTEAKPKVMLTDSLAALTTDFELDTGDKMGMRRAKEFSAGLRVNARIISQMLMLCSNQERDSDKGKITPGGNAIGYYASLRIRVKQSEKIELEKKMPSGASVKKVIGIVSDCIITKSTVDDPYRTAPIYIIFGYGIDDIRANLQYLKNMKKTSTYVCPDGKSAIGMEQAIRHVESHDLAKPLRDETITVWHEVETMFAENRDRRKNRC